MKTGPNYAIKNQIGGNKDITFLVVALLASVAALCLYVGPAYGETQALIQQNGIKRNDLKSKQDLLKNIQKFNEESSGLGGNAEKLEALVANRNNFEDYLDMIAALALKRNLEVNNLGLGAVESSVEEQDTVAASADTAELASKPTFPLQEQGVKFTVEGEYENILEFIRDLENGIPFVQEDTLEISTDDGGEQVGAEGEPISPNLSVTMEFKFNYY